MKRPMVGGAPLGLCAARSDARVEVPADQHDAPLGRIIACRTSAK
jgi:hypothetical protein